MNSYDLAIAHKWIYDRELTELIEKMFHENGLTTYLIDIYNYSVTTELIRNNNIRFKAILDRASDEDERFAEMAEVVSKSGTYIINDYQKTDDAVDKHKMHKILIEEGFPLPFTIVVPPFEESEVITLTDADFSKLGSPFIIKPSYYTGGAEGVNLNAVSMQDVNNSRQEFPDDYYLLQEKIYPQLHNGHRVWIRAYWFFDEVFLLWWDDQTHIYYELDNNDYNLFDLKKVADYTTRIAQITGMDYFSTEATIDINNNLYIIDYVNDQCDMRMKPEHFDGVPKVLVERFIEKMIKKVKSL